MIDPPPGFITGRVVDLAGVPVGGARVFRWWHPSWRQPTVETTSDAAGRFRLGPLPTELDAILFFESPQHARARREDVVVFPGIDHELGDLVLMPGIVVTGGVCDERGDPLSSATVTVHAYYRIFQHTIEPVGPEWVLRTRADGKFTSPPIPPERVGVRIDCPGWSRWESFIPETPVPRVHDLGVQRLKPEHVHHGRVIDHEGAPIAGAWVRADVDYANATHSDVDGRFTIRGQPGDMRQLEVRARGFAHRRFYLSGSPAPTEVVLDRAFEVSGVIVDEESGDPVSPRGVGLGLIAKGDFDGSFIAVENGSELTRTNHFRLWYEEPAEYVVAVGAEGYEPGRLPLGMLDPPRDVHGLELRMRRSDDSKARAEHAALSGRVLDLPAGTIGWASLWWALRKEQPPNAAVRRGVPIGIMSHVAARVPLAPDLSFRFEDASGPYWLRIDLPGRAPELRGPLALAPGSATTLDVALAPPSRLRGSLALAANDRAGRNWMVATDRRIFITTSQVASDGRFEFPSLPAGRYALHVGSDDDSWQIRRATRSSGGARAHLEDDVEEVRRAVPIAEVELRPGETCDVGELKIPDRE